MTAKTPNEDKPNYDRFNSLQHDSNLLHHDAINAVRKEIRRCIQIRHRANRIVNGVQNISMKLMTKQLETLLADASHDGIKHTDCLEDVIRIYFEKEEKLTKGHDELMRLSLEEKAENL